MQLRHKSNNNKRSDTSKSNSKSNKNNATPEADAKWTANCRKRTIKKRHTSADVAAAKMLDWNRKH